MSFSPNKINLGWFAIVWIKKLSWKTRPTVDSSCTFSLPITIIMQQEVGSGRLPTHAIMMTTYSIALSISSTAPACNWPIDKKARWMVTKPPHRLCELVFMGMGKAGQKRANLTLDQICPQLLNTASNAFSLLFFLPRARAHIPHAAGRAHANLLASAVHRSPWQCPCSCLRSLPGFSSAPLDVCAGGRGDNCLQRRLHLSPRHKPMLDFHL